MQSLAKIILLASIMGLAMLLAYNKGIVEGRNTALKTNPVSQELEMVCAGLWVGEQNKKFWEKTK